jgi:predicted GIY-YIG superfamily endonuclease
VTAVELSPVPVAVRLVHRVACDGCGWIGYRRDPWCRDCPACGVDRSKLRPVWLAGCAPHAGRCCYLIHIWPPPADPAHPWPGYRHACHYLGSTTDLPRRWSEHLAGGYDPATHKNNGPGSRLLAAALYAGCTVELVRVWYGSQARRLEQRLKQRRKPDAGSLRAGAARSLKPLCPVCNPDGWWRRYPDLPDPPPSPRPRRFVHDPELWDVDAEWSLAFPHLAYGTPAVAAAAIPGGRR